MRIRPTTYLSLLLLEELSVWKLPRVEARLLLPPPPPSEPRLREAKNSARSFEFRRGPPNWVSGVATL